MVFTDIYVLIHIVYFDSERLSADALNKMTRTMIYAKARITKNV